MFNNIKILISPFHNALDCHTLLFGYVLAIYISYVKRLCKQASGAARPFDGVPICKVKRGVWTASVFSRCN